MRRGRRERTPSPVEDEEEEEEEHVQGEEEEDEEEAEEGAAGGEQDVWLRGPSQLPRRPLPLVRRLIIRPLDPK